MSGVVTVPATSTVVARVWRWKAPVTSSSSSVWPLAAVSSTTSRSRPSLMVLAKARNTASSWLQGDAGPPTGSIVVAGWLSAGRWFWWA
jgi:hypothetical protein